MVVEPATLLDVARELLEPVVAHAEAEMLRGDVLELMRFVDDRAAAGGDDLAVRVLANRRVRAQQVVVDDDDVGFGGALAHAGDETVVVARTLGAQARVGGRRDLVPERQILGQIAQLRAIADLGPGGPLADDRQKHIVDRRTGAVVELIELVQAHVVRATLHARGGEGNAEGVAQRRDVLEVDLLLEVLRAGGDEHALAAQDGGHEIRECLAGAGPGLGEQDAAAREDLRHRGGHFDLPGAWLEVRHRTERAVRRARTWPRPPRSGHRRSSRSRLRPMASASRRP